MAPSVIPVNSDGVRAIRCARLSVTDITYLYISISLSMFDDVNLFLIGFHDSLPFFYRTLCK